jgi:anthranilate synthase component 1
MHYPDFESFSKLASQGNLIPVYREIMADMDTPVSAFRKIDDGRYSFLLESIEGGEMGQIHISRLKPRGSHPL